MKRSDPRPRIAPLVLATMASQALLVVLSPTIVAIGAELGASVGAVGQARSITAATAILVSVAIAGRIGVLGLRRVLGIGAGLAAVACLGVAVAPNVAVFFAVHLLVGVGFAFLLTGGFAGVSAFPSRRRPHVVGYVTAANALAWIVVNPAVGLVTDVASWRVAQAVPATIALAALVAAGKVAEAPGAGEIPRLRDLFSGRSARRWIVSELIAYGSWTALLTFIGAYFMEVHDVGQSTVGWFLAAGAAAYFVASARSGIFATLLRRRHLVAITGVMMAGLILVQLNVATSVLVAVATFCVVGFVGGVRTPGSSGLGLDQLPDHPGAMMAARTAATQLGYLLGAVVGGAVIAGPGYGALGILLAGGMVVSAVLILGVEDPLEAGEKRDRKGETR